MLKAVRLRLLRRGLTAPVPTKEINGILAFDVPPHAPRITSEHVVISRREPNNAVPARRECFNRSHVAGTRIACGRANLVRTQSKRNWATCPLTQAGFVRISSDPAVSPNAVLPHQAVDLLNANLRHPNHVFWADHLPLAQAIEPFRLKLTGYRQLTDAYLLGLAANRQGGLGTLDRAIVILAREAKLQEHVELISST